MFTQQTQLFRSQQNSQFSKNDSNKRIGVLVFVDELLKNAKKFILGNFDEKWKKDMSGAMGKMANEPRRLAKVHQHFRLPESQVDRGLKLSQFIEAWNIIVSMLDKELGEILREQQLTESLITIETSDLALPAFISILNEFKKELKRSSTNSLLKIFESIDERIVSKRAVNGQWKEIVAIMIEEISVKGQLKVNNRNVAGKILVRESLVKWLSLSIESTLFESVLFIASKLDLHELYLECFSQIAKDLAKCTSEENENIEETQEKVVVASWKTLILMRFIPDINKRHFPMLLSIVQAWPISETPNRRLLPILKCLHSTFDQAEIGKTFLKLFKQDCSKMLHSEFGFGAMIQLCAIERYKSEAIQSLKRALSRVFKFDEASQKIGWLKFAIGASIADEAKLQMKNLSTRMNDRENWTLLSPGAISLCYSLFDTAQNQKVLVCDGRAASVPDLWTLASTLLSEAIGRSGNNLSTLLLPLVSTIAIHSNSINVSAAIVLIDVLVEVVHNCTIEVLNNYKQIEGIFDWVCRMRRDIAVSLIRTLLPIINQRSQLRQSLFAALKRDLLNSTSVTSAVPLLLSLLQSISNRRNVTLSQGGMSQSFATFSSQSLAKMGLTRGVDEALGLEIVGVLKRCLAQPAQTRAALYSGITEVVHRNIQISGPCLELLLSHANTLPQWSTKEMILTSRTMTTVREAFPQLIQAIESLTCASISSIQAGFTQSHSGGDLLVQKAESLLLKWVNIAIERDIHEMELDKLTEWTPTTQEGRGNLLFAHQMLAVYDALLEFLWRRINSDIDSSEMELDRLIGIIRQRKELLEVLNEKTIRQKQEKAVNGNGVQTGNGDSKLMPLNLQEVDIYVSGRTISQLLDRLLKMDESDKLWEIKGELLNWTIKSSLKWSEELRKGELPLHSNVLRHSHLVNVAKHFLEIYIGDEVDSPAWTQEIPMISKTKTEALEVYSNIVRYSLLKYQRKILEYVVLMWKDDRTGGGEAGALSRHGVFLLNRLYFGLVIEDENAETPKKREIESEKQAKIITKLVNSLLLAANRSSTRASHIFVKTYWDILEQNEFATIQVLRDSLNAFADTSLQVQANAAITSIYKRILTIADALYSRYMGEEPSDEDPKCVSKEFGSAFIEFLILILEKSMLAIKEVVFHMSEFVEKDQWDEIFTHIVTRLVTCTEILQKMMQIHTDVGVAKEKISTTLTMFYDGFEISIKLLLDNAKVLKNDMGKWKSIESLSRLLKGELHTLLVHCDENVGEIEQEKKSKSATKITKIRREENLYVKYTRARESLQATILRLSVALNDDRLDLQVKKNSIGTRDFRMNLKKFLEKAQENEELSDVMREDQNKTIRSNNEISERLNGSQNKTPKNQKRMNPSVKEEPQSPEIDNIENEPSSSKRKRSVI